MARLLCIETATTNCSVTIAIDGGIVLLKEDYNNTYSHAEKLHLFIREAVAEAKLELKDLDAIVISKGPGSYTGLRIGVSAAKGLCYSLDIPLISVETLEALAQQVHEDTLIIPMLDARRMEVFSAIYSADKSVLRTTQAQILDESSFEAELASGIVTFIGNGVNKFEEICNHPNARFVDALPSAKDMVTIAEAKFENSKFEDVAYFEPYYLKDFVAGKKAKY